MGGGRSVRCSVGGECLTIMGYQIGVDEEWLLWDVCGGWG